MGWIRMDTRRKPKVAPLRLHSTSPREMGPFSSRPTSLQTRCSSFRSAMRRAYVFGQWWFGDAKWSRTNQIATLIPKDCQAIHKTLGDDGVFSAQADVPFLQASPSRLVEVRFATKE